MKRVFLVMLSVLLVMSSMTGCLGGSDEDDVRATVENFFACYNNGDYDGMIEFLTEKQQKMLDRTMGFMGDLVGIDVSSLMPLLFGISSEVFEGEMLNFEIDKIEIDGDKATVYGDLGVSMDTVSQDSYAAISLVKEGTFGDWKISLLNPQARMD